MLDRRSFLKLGAAGTACAAAGAAVARSGRRVADGGFLWNRSVCRMCGVGCGLQVGVEGGRVVAVAGDPDAPVNKGLLCVKGYQSGSALYGEDRLTTPLLRRDGRLAPISWDQAIRLVADRVGLGAAGFALYGGGGWSVSEAYVAQKFAKAILANNQVVTSARIADAAVTAATRTVYGDDAPLASYDDLDAADAVVCWSANPAEEHPVLFTRLTDRRLSGEELTLLDIGARRTRTSAAAQAVIRCRPGAEDVVLRGILRLVLDGDAFDGALVQGRCTFRLPGPTPDAPTTSGTLEDWKLAVAAYTPDAVQRRTDVRVADLQMLANLYGSRTRKVLSLWSDTLNQRVGAASTNLLLHALHLLTGHLGRPGDGTLVLGDSCNGAGLREVGVAPDALPGGMRVDDADDRAFCEALWNLPKGRLSATPGLEPMRLWERFSTGREDGGDIHTIWVQASNPAQSLPDAGRMFEPSRHDPDKFLIVSDVYPSPTTEVADLVLPSTFWLEKAGVYGNYERRSQQWGKLVAGPTGARDDAWQLVAVAAELHARGFAGAGDRDGRFLYSRGLERSPADWAYWTSIDADQVYYDEYRGFTARRTRTAATYAQLRASHGLRWPVAGTEESPRRYPRGGDAGLPEFTARPDGRAQLVLPADVAVGAAKDPNFPLQLTIVPVVEHTGTGNVTGRIPQLRRAMPHAYLEMNRQDSERYGVHDGETVVLSSSRGELRIPVWIEGRGAPMPGQVCVPAFDARLRALGLVSVDPDDGRPDLGICAVRVQRLVG